MVWHEFVAGALSVISFILVTAAAIILVRTHRASRATVFADMLLRTTLLFMALLYLAFVEDAGPRLLPGQPALYATAAAAGYLLLAGFLLATAMGLWRLTKRTDGAIIVTPDFLIGLRSRTAAMYGDGPSRFIVYAVGKESAEKAMRQFLAGTERDAAGLWRKIPGWFRQMGYGHMQVLEASIGTEVRLRVDDTIEAVHDQDHRGGCDMTRGYLAGLGGALHPGMDCECVEVHCGSMRGGGHCDFTLHWFPRASATEEMVTAVPTKGA